MSWCHVIFLHGDLVFLANRSLLSFQELVMRGEVVEGDYFLGDLPRWMKSPVSHTMYLDV